MKEERISEIIKSDLNVFRALLTLLFTSVHRVDQKKHFFELMVQFVKTKQTIKKFKKLGLITTEEFLDSEKKLQKEVTNFFEEYRTNRYSFTPEWLKLVC